MPSLMGPIPASTVLQDGYCGYVLVRDVGVPAWATGDPAYALATDGKPNGNSLNLTGATRGFLYIDIDDPEDGERPTQGVLTFEVSYDDGWSWAATDAVSRTDTADDSTHVHTLDWSALPAMLKVDPLNGQVLLRARVSTMFDAPVSVVGWAVGR